MSDVKEAKKVIVMIKLIGPWASVGLACGIVGYIIGKMF